MDLNIEVGVEGSAYAGCWGSVTSALALHSVLKPPGSMMTPEQYQD
jgi:hypothetical protein